MENKDVQKRLEYLMQKLSDDEKRIGEVYQVCGAYFIVFNGSIMEISDDAGDGPKGGWFPDIVRGPSKEINDYLGKIMKKYDFDEGFFYEYFEDCFEYDEDSAWEYFEEADEETFKIYKKMIKEFESGKTPFESMEDFVLAVRCYGLDKDRLYYEWEGEWIDFYDNILDTGESRGNYENLSDEEWLAVLENIDNYKV